MTDANGDEVTLEQEEETTFWRVFHWIFGHGSSDNPGGDARLEFAGWGLVLAPLWIPLWALFDDSDDPMGWAGAPIAVLLGVFLVRAAKKMPR